MLVLSRKLEQEICIGDDIRIRIIKIKGNTVRIGIEAPGDVKVIRAELAFDPKAANPKAADQKESLPNHPSAVVDTTDAARLGISRPELDNQATETIQIDCKAEPLDSRQILPMSRVSKAGIFPSTNTRMQEWVQQVTKPR